MPMADWALVFSGPLFRNRLQPDFLSRNEEYLSEFLVTLQKLGIWSPQ